MELGGKPDMVKYQEPPIWGDFCCDLNWQIHTFQGRGVRIRNVRRNREIQRYRIALGGQLSEY